VVLRDGSTYLPADAIVWRQEGYGIFSVSQSNRPEVEQYINNQAQHHRRRTFQEEYLEFLKKNEIEFDPRYIWD
jgi:putative transposase